MKIILDPTTGVPLYRQLADALQVAIASGAFEGGQELPGARELAEELRVNYHTVRRALQELEESGVIERQRGGPYRVAEGAGAPLEVLREDAERMARRAMELGIDAESALDLLADALAALQPAKQERA